MGDSRDKDGGDHGNQNQAVDSQFLEDLERATRLSLESFKAEQEARTPGKRVLVKERMVPTIITDCNGRDKVRELEITPRPRPSSRPISAASSSQSQSSGSRISSGSNGSILSPPVTESPVTSIPPPSPFKRHRSLPYRRHITHPPIVDPVEEAKNDYGGHLGETNVKSTHHSDDLILLASPLVTPKFSLNHRTSSAHCDTTYAFPLDDISPTSPPMGSTFPQFSVTGREKGLGMIHGTSAQKSNAGFSPSSSQSATFYPHTSQSSSQGAELLMNSQQNSYATPLSYPKGTHGIGTTSTVIGGILHNLGKSPGGHLAPLRNRNGPLSPASQGHTNLYKRVSDELREMGSGDLIDFGCRPTMEAIKESGSKNILEYFDPLVIRETERREAEEAERLRKEKAEQEATKAANAENVEEVYNASCVSTATSAFSYRPNSSGNGSLSLYPSLQDCEYESLYGALSGSLCRMKESAPTDASSFYDVYNPFEYLYTVSCSTPSGPNADLVQKAKIINGENGVRPIGFALPESSSGGHFSGTVAAHIGPALPPRNSIESSSDASSSIGSTSSRVQLRIRSLSHDKSKRGGKLYENIENMKNLTSTDSEVQAFYEMIREIRFSCRHVDSTTNKSYIRSPVLENKCNDEGHSVKIVVWPEEFCGDPVTFTCDIYSGAEVALEHSILELCVDGSGRDYLLRVKGLNEYLDPEIPLANYVYVQQCIKLDQDLQLIIVKRSSILKETWARTGKDDAKSVSIEINDILPEVQAKTINYTDISIPLEVIDRESDRIKEKVNLQMYGGSRETIGTVHLSPASIMQPVKAVCVLLKEVVTIEIVTSLNLFAKACDEWNSKVTSPSPDSRRLSLDPFDSNRRRTKIIGDLGTNYSFVEVLPYRRSSFDESVKDSIFGALDRVIDSVRSLVEMYSKSFPVSFRMKEVADKARPESQDIKPMGETIEPFMIRVGAVHRLKPEWLTTYVNYLVSVDVYHGTRWMGKQNTEISSASKADGHWFFNSVVFDAWISFDHLPICILPRESRVVLTLFGRKPSDDNNNIIEIIELGWTSMQFFNFKGLLAQGNFLLPFWQVGLVQKRLGPAPNSSFSSDGNSPLLTVEFCDFGQDMYFPEIPSALPIPRDFCTLDNNTQLLLMDIIENSTFTKFPAEDFEVLWEKRHYLQDFPQALPKVLLAAQLWDWASIAELHAMLQNWRQLDPVDALQLLLPCFPDTRVREIGVLWISGMADEDLMNLLPQLVEALSYETFDLSPLARFLLKKSLSSAPFSHNFFWMLASQIGLGKWVSEESHCDPVISRISRVDTENTYDPKRRRLELMLNSLMIICGEKWRSALISQYKMIENLSDIAFQVKSASKDSARMNILWTELQRMSANIFPANTSFPLPTSASAHVKSVHPNPKMCSYFNSNAVPLKISFLNGLPEGGCISTIFKAGDDLRQDMLTSQTIRLIEKWWLKEGLDLRVLTFSCVPTGFRQGMVEMVPNAETLCKIQAEYGVTGVFRDSAIADWLAKMNPSTLDYRRAIDNFTLSCAAYCVLTYVLGICDRHNDNIMLTKKGHLFHIDFGKFLGDAQMFIKFKRDRTPFVLTADMIYVINDGEKGSLRFHRFVELCCQAFRIIRKNGNILLNLFALMVTAGIPGVDLSSVNYIQKALLPDCSNVEAAAKFTRFIEESSQNWFTPVNFFIHSLAQLRFSSDSASENPTTLSFVPIVYTMEEEGRIEKALLVSYQKKYDPEKYYSYTIKVKRKGQCDWFILHRSYKEFLELRSKLCINFPKADGTMKPLPKGGGIGRSNVKQVAEKRRFYLQAFLDSLFTLADEVGHSALVYTFFHPILRDEEPHLDEEYERKEAARASLMKNPSRIHGQIKLSLEYLRGALLVLVQHAVDLACPNGQPPSPYVKTYLRPDTSRLTKRKTRVVRRSKHPSFMEMIEYRLPLDMIRQRVLEISVWHHDSLQENSFLGGVSIPLGEMTLDKETMETYPLSNLTIAA